MKKTSLFLLLTLLVVLLFTVACGNSATGTTAASTETVETTPSVATSTQTPGSTTTPTTTTPATTASVTTQKPTPVANPVKLLTFNLRYDTTSHPCMSLDVRGPHLMEIIKKYDPDSISFCEATDDWMNYLRNEMSKLGYGCVGVGRNAGQTGPTLTGSGNEHSPVFYKTDKYDLLDSNTFWISTNPEMKGTTSWDSSMNRICSYAVLKNKETGAMYAHFGTHLDHKGPESRESAALVIESYIHEVLDKYGDVGIVLSGDFNDSMQSNMYLSFTSFLDDARNLAKEKLVTGSTFNGYSPDEWERNYAGDKKPTVGTSSPIDYIFLGKNTATVSLYTVVNDLFTFEAGGKTWTDHPVSDHYGVYCEANFTAPTKNLKYDENKIITPRATFSPSQTLPSSYKGLPVINDLFSIKSTLNQTSPIENILKNDSSVGTVMTGSIKHSVWEITLSADTATAITGISFTTGTASKKTPQNLRVYVSHDGSSWRRLGNAYTEEITASTTYYLSTPSPNVLTKYVKFVFSDCSTGAELTNLTIYGK